MRRRKSREFALQILFSLENTAAGMGSVDPTAAPGLVSEYLKNFGTAGFRPEQRRGLPAASRPRDPPRPS